MKKLKYSKATTNTPTFCEGLIAFSARIFKKTRTKIHSMFLSLFQQRIYKGFRNCFEHNRLVLTFCSRVTKTMKKSWGWLNARYHQKLQNSNPQERKLKLRQKNLYKTRAVQQNLPPQFQNHFAALMMMMMKILTIHSRFAFILLISFSLIGFFPQFESHEQGVPSRCRFHKLYLRPTPLQKS